MKGDKAEKKAAKAEKKAEQAKKKAAKKAVSAEKKAAKMKKQAEAKAAKEEKKAKKRIEQQEKRAEKLAQEAGEEMEQQEKKKGNKKILLLIPVMALAGAALVYFLVIPKLFPKEPEIPEETEPEPIEAPVVYQLGSASIPALPAWGEILVYQEDPAPPAPAAGVMPENLSAEDETEDAEEDAAEDTEITAVVYRYEGYADPHALAVSYAELMTTKDAGFSFVDESLMRLEEEAYPDLETSAGSVFMARNAFTEDDAGKAMTIQLDWTEENCLVTLDLVAGSVRNPPSPVSAIASGSSGMTSLEAMEYIYSMDPAKLGLAGDSMEDYTIYAMDGVVMIDDIPCMHMNVYQESELTGTTQVAGNFFISADGQHIYRLDVETNRVEELDAIG